ncbi:hypothetical protein [Sulfuricurvum sp.]|uniref:hypothetical protein n=1 Tax=Sulfuricurvum sp. TaxID=2025608 RepID=UPI0026202C6B|nr:hypothetical protein [Sulfuricurvum sp.]MDD2781406.1 hypothetical protein [Sulfuricurvum sp.]
MRRTAYWLFPLIAIAVAIFIILFLIQINPTAPRLKISDTEDVLPSSTSSEDKSWIGNFSKSEEKEYFYPVNEVMLNLDPSHETLTPESNETTK